jgi:hypothetical protein
MLIAGNPVEESRGRTWVANRLGRAGGILEDTNADPFLDRGKGTFSSFESMDVKKRAVNILGRKAGIDEFADSDNGVIRD